jgi:GTP 3',8-cyclase
MAFNLPVLRAVPNAGQNPGPPPPAPPEARARQCLIDSHGRTIRDLRLSVTDRCNFRCIYCMDPGVRFLPKQELLKAADMIRLARICADLGVQSIRLTGGEPLVYAELDDVIRGIAADARIRVALTTNGSLLDSHRLSRLRRAGLARLTISIDSITPDSFARLTRSQTSVRQVTDAIESAIRAGLSPVKANAVVLRGSNEEELPKLAALARELGIEMRFIEFMPLDSGKSWDRTRLVPASEILSRISQQYPLTPLGRDEPSSTAMLYRFADGAPGRIGIIAPVTRPFCNQCSRLRITADGHVRPCLFSNQEWDLRPLLRGKASDAQIASFLVDATWTKQAGHGISSAGFVQPNRHMAAIGG